MDISTEMELSNLLLSPECLPDIKQYLRSHFKSKPGKVESPDALKWLLSILSWTNWKYFIQALEGPAELSKEYLLSGEWQILTETGTAQISQISIMGSTSKNLAIPEEIKQYIKEFDFDTLKKDKPRSTLVHLYAAAAANAYGIIEINTFLRMFNVYMDEQPNLIEQPFSDRFPLSTNELRSIMEPYSVTSIDVLLMEDKLVHRMVNGSDMERFMKRVKYNEYYPFSKNRLLKYVRENYYEETLPVKIFKDALRGKIQWIDEYQLEYILLTFAPCYLIEWEETIGMGLADLPEVRKKENRELFARLFVNAKNSLPNWIYKGYSLDELIKIGRLKESGIEEDVAKFFAIIET